MPGGVNSPVRAFSAVGGEPPFIYSGSGSHIYDVDGNSYIDYVCSWGPLILGHAHPAVVREIKRVAERGTSFGAPTELEVTLAEMIVSAMPSLQMVRFVNSGTEAAISAIRLARAFTGRNKIIKFAGGYHGHSDGLLVRSGSGLMSSSLPDSAGVPPHFAADTLVAPYNDLDAVRLLLERYPYEVAAIIVEPVAANMGVVPPKEGFLQGLREITEKAGSLLIFDEVITGFRVGYNGMQGILKINPDLTCLGKIIGGGLPAAAYGGRREIMSYVAPLGSVYQAGTLSGNPLAMAAGIETLRQLSGQGVYERLEVLGRRLEEGILEASRRYGVDLKINRMGSMLTIFFTSSPVTRYDEVINTDRERFSHFFHGLLENGVYWPPSPFEATFISLAHSEDDIEATLEAIRQTIAELGKI